MSRPLLGLILVNYDSFGKIQESLCSAQPQDKQAQLAKVTILTNNLKNKLKIYLVFWAFDGRNWEKSTFEK